jgi:hypothetical protein
MSWITKRVEKMIFITSSLICGSGGGFRLAVVVVGCCPCCYAGVSERCVRPQQSRFVGTFRMLFSSASRLLAASEPSAVCRRRVHQRSNIGAYT